METVNLPPLLEPANLYTLLELSNFYTMLGLANIYSCGTQGILGEVMITKNYSENINFNYNLSLIDKPENILFFDIETTGLSRKFNKIYLIGCMRIIDHQAHISQFFAQEEKEEIFVLRSFLTELNNCTTIVQFNGSSFDIPFVTERCEEYGLHADFNSKKIIDIYKLIKPYSRILNLPNLKQKSLELFLGLERKDAISGGELIPVYKDYLKHKDDVQLRLLLLHNLEDVFFMGKLVSLLTLLDYFNGINTCNNFEISDSFDANHNPVKELKITSTLSQPLNFNINFLSRYFFMFGRERQIIVTVTVQERELKYFFDNYKDYYFIPQEDMAMHKDVAAFIDKDRRIKASAQNCYIRKKGHYVPIPAPLESKDFIFKNYFKDNYKDKISYIDTDELNDENIHLYLMQLLKTYKLYM